MYARPTHSTYLYMLLMILLRPGDNPSIQYYVCIPCTQPTYMHGVHQQTRPCDIHKTHLGDEQSKFENQLQQFPRARYERARQMLGCFQILSNTLYKIGIVSEVLRISEEKYFPPRPFDQLEVDSLEVQIMRHVEKPIESKQPQQQNHSLGRSGS